MKKMSAVNDLNTLVGQVLFCKRQFRNNFLTIAERQLFIKERKAPTKILIKEICGRLVNFYCFLHSQKGISYHPTIPLAKICQVKGGKYRE